jgi:hypothetical protein
MWTSDAWSFGNGLRRLPARHLPGDPLSNRRRRTGILMDIYPVLLLRKLKPRQIQLPRSGIGRTTD